MGRLGNLLNTRLRLPKAPYLARRIRYRVVGKYLGGVLMVLAAAFVAMAAVSFMLGEGPSAVIFYAAYSAITAIAGSALYRRVPEKEASVPEAAVVAGASFLLASVVGALPFALLGHMPPLDAWFESMSGFTTTGFSLMDVTAAPASLLFFRALSQWLGGMGFVVITVALLLVSGRSAVTFLADEHEERLFPTLARHVRLLIITYSALTAASIAMLLAAGLDPLSAACYTLAGVSTGGFAIHADSIAGLDNTAASIPVMLIMLTGSVNFALYYRSWRESAGAGGAVRGFFSNPQVLALIFLTAATGFLLGLTMTGPGRFTDGLFLAVSAQTTTGYYTANPALLSGFPLIIIIGSMFIGGSMGSTAGGIKLFRLMEIVKGVNRFFLFKLYPRETVFPGGPSGKGVETEELLGILYVPVIYAAAVFVAGAIFAWYGHDPLRSFFEVTSAVGTVGLSAGIVGPGLEGGLKVLLTLLMWAGRLEFLPIIVWLYSIAER